MQAYNSNIAQVIAANPKVHYVIPSEGGTMWIDGFAIPKSAANADAAYRFIDYLLQPAVAAKAAADLSKAATVVDAAKAMLPEGGGREPGDLSAGRRADQGRLHPRHRRGHEALPGRLDQGEDGTMRRVRHAR